MSRDAPTPPAIRVIAGARQLGRLKHDILAVGPTLLLPGLPTARNTGWTGGCPAGSPPIVRFVSAISGPPEILPTSPSIPACSWVRANSSRSGVRSSPSYTNSRAAAEGNLHHRRGAARGRGGSWRDDDVARQNAQRGGVLWSAKIPSRVEIRHDRRESRQGMAGRSAEPATGVASLHG